MTRPMIQSNRTAHAVGAQVPAGAGQSLIIGVTAFLTVVDLFAAQALLPSLVQHYQVSPAAMGLAVNACTLGMAVAGFLVALFGGKIDKRNGIIISLVVLSLPTAALAFAPSLSVFAALRVLQGLCMATAFSLTLAHLGERYSAAGSRRAFAAYITGNVASNLAGRMIAATVAGSAGLPAAFFVFAALNLVGALLVYVTVPRLPDQIDLNAPGAMLARWLTHLSNPRLRASFAIGFLILFAFIGTFTFVNFVLVAPPLGVSMMQMGVIYLVFLPSIFTTPLAGAVAERIGTQRALVAGLGAAGLGLPLLLASQLACVVAGLVLVAAGTFFAQAVTTGFVGRIAHENRNAASGLYLASYFLGGLAGTAVIGQLFDRFGWTAAVAGVAAALVAATALTRRLTASPEPGNTCRAL